MVKLKIIYIPYSVADGETDFLVEPKNSEKLAENFNYLL